MCEKTMITLKDHTVVMADQLPWEPIACGQHVYVPYFSHQTLGTSTLSERQEVCVGGQTTTHQGFDVGISPRFFQNLYNS